MACGFDALADLEELQMEKSPYTPNTRLQITSEPRTEHFLIFTGLFIRPWAYRYTVIYFPNLKYPLHFLSELQLHLLSRGFGINMLDINLRPLKDILYVITHPTS
jgi:hypothetical protein